ncbi:MAG: hypothetical protein HY821_18825, partial [Acidobacteria bacterium]|nr:hypothetical protein [Acidobacteriota bacterium]
MTRRHFVFALQQVPSFRVSARAVVVPVTVLNSKDQRVAGLEKTDFRLLDNGVDRDFILEEMNAPVSVMLAVETA